GKLKQDRIEKLEQHSVWNWSFNGQFEKRFDALRKWVQDNNQLPGLSSSSTRHERILCAWCNNRKIEYSKGKLPLWLITDLETIPNWTWQNIDPFDQLYQGLQRWLTFHKRYPRSTAENG